MAEILAKFDAQGRRLATVLSGIHYITDEGRQKYIDDGYIPISDEHYQYYIGSRGIGDNGTGYIHDKETGKPISAPPTLAAEPQEMDVQPIPETELAVMEGMIDMQTRLAALEVKLKGGE